MHRDRRTKLLFLLPAVIWVLCFTIFPLVYGVRLSFQRVNPDGTEDYVGLANYRNVFTKDRAQNSMVVTAVFVACGVAVQMIPGDGPGAAV